ncbi:MAG: prephenate dehydratase [Gammaproteobacteria bacterium]|jgi:chorismate mutase/prephenate dehydratase
MSAHDELSLIRDKIDNVDRKLCDLINERADLAVTVSKIKANLDTPEYYRPEREAEILRRILTDYNGALNKEDVAHIFQEIMRLCLALQQQQKIAFLGPIGTFSHACALRHFGHQIDIYPHDTLDDVFSSIENDEAHFGLIPFENSIAGVVNPALDLLMNSTLFICGEHIMPIHQNLLRHKEDKGDIKRIYSHSHSFEQCKEWLNVHMPHVERITVKSNAAAAAIAQTEKNVACIAGELAADIYKLDIVHANIETNKHNATRFVVIGKQKIRPSGKDKTSIVFATPHTPGALINLILPFHEQGINLLSITSRPNKTRNWSYLFFIDIEGHQDDIKVKTALTQLEGGAGMIHVLGSYPIAIL